MISRRTGFTVIELMITVAIVAILATIAAPSLRDLTQNARMTSLANDLMTDLSVARGEAVKRGVSVTICSSNNGTSCTASEWRYGWIVFAETNLGGTEGSVDSGEGPPLKVASKINGADEDPPSLIINPNPYVTFRPTGVTTPGGGGVTNNFLLCDSRRTDTVSAAAALNRGRHITVIPSGRAQVTRCTCANITTCTP